MRARILLAAGAAVLVALLAWRLWPRAGQSAGDAALPAPDATGALTLAESQRVALGIEPALVEAADAVPLPGLPGESVPPLDGGVGVSAPWPGSVVTVFVDNGDRVVAGQPLLRVRSAEAARALAERDAARSAAQLAARTARRDTQLLAEGIIAIARAEASRANARTANAELERSEAALAGLRVPPGAARGEFELLAPVAGRVLRRSAQPGSRLEAHEEALMIADPDRLDLVVGVPLRWRGLLAPGLSIALPDGTRAIVTHVGADSDPDSQRIRLRARFDALGEHIAGERLAVTLALAAPDGALRLPRTALLTRGDRHVAFRRDGDRYFPVPVGELLGGDDESVVVLAPELEPGMQVVAQGAVALKALARTE